MNKHAEKYPNVFLTQGLIDLGKYGLVNDSPKESKLRVISQAFQPQKLHPRHGEVALEDFDINDLVNSGMKDSAVPVPAQDDLYSDDEDMDLGGDMDEAPLSMDDIGGLEQAPIGGVDNGPQNIEPDMDDGIRSDDMVEGPGAGGPQIPDWKQELQQWLKANS